MAIRRFGVIPKNVRPIREEIIRRDMKAAENVRKTNKIFEIQCESCEYHYCPHVLLQQKK